ncbi:hypothetical protein B0H19DRAFT_1384713 [Mycena capillaripes]|nr:hypothetical protein B0H19DRAFT_1384713 [Mycena capillaripes]
MILQSQEGRLQSDNTNNFAAGDSLIAHRYKRMQVLPHELAAFPAMPMTLDGFAATNLTSRPTFFGCTPSAARNALEPLLVRHLQELRRQTGRDGDEGEAGQSIDESELAKPEHEGHILARDKISRRNGGAQPAPLWAKCSLPIPNAALEKEGPFNNATRLRQREPLPKKRTNDTEAMGGKRGGNALFEM